MSKKNWKLRNHQKKAVVLAAGSLLSECKSELLGLCTDCKQLVIRKNQHLANCSTMLFEDDKGQEDGPEQSLRCDWRPWWQWSTWLAEFIVQTWWNQWFSIWCGSGCPAISSRSLVCVRSICWAILLIIPIYHVLALKYVQTVCLHVWPANCASICGTYWLKGRPDQICSDSLICNI